MTEMYQHHEQMKTNKDQFEDLVKLIKIASLSELENIKRLVEEFNKKPEIIQSIKNLIEARIKIREDFLKSEYMGNEKTFKRNGKN